MNQGQSFRGDYFVARNCVKFKYNLKTNINYWSNYHVYVVLQKKIIRNWHPQFNREKTLGCLLLSIVQVYIFIILFKKNAVKYKS